ncbi:hypothetical protein ACFQ61_10120 [Streptomyces sp. NPDC056500]|uniref:hypothetical protein n=1 Tax=Streptomyces sp. NPDC056500 TaxID=3345840 RepID=UPI00367B4579
MTRRTITVAITATLLALGLAGCGQSYEDTVNDCHAALKDRSESETGKPDECADVKEDDYTALVIGVAVDRNGWTNEDGDFDMNKLLEDTEQP